MNMAVDWIFEGKYEQAKREIDGLFKLNPKSLQGLNALGWIGDLEKDCDAVRATRQRLAEWYPDLDDKASTAIGEARCGDAEAARQQLEVLARAPAGKFVSPYSIAEAYAILGDADHGIEYLERSAAARESTILYLEIDSLLDPIRRDARFTALERRVGVIQ